MSFEFATASRIVVGQRNLTAACMHLASSEVWFNVQPLPGDRYEITVRKDSGHLLPACRDWREADDSALLAHAINQWGEDFDGDGIRLREPRVVERQDRYYIVTAEVRVDYPENTA